MLVFCHLGIEVLENAWFLYSTISLTRLFTSIIALLYLLVSSTCLETHVLTIGTFNDMDQKYL